MDYSNYNKDSNEFWCSWTIILLALYFFFPVGIYLIIKKSRLHRRNIFTIGKKTFSTSISLFIFSILLYLPKIILRFSEFTNNLRTDLADLEKVVNSEFYSKVLNFGNWFFILGFVVLLISFYQKYKAKQYQNYISNVVNKERENLDEIANKMQLSKSKVIKDLKSMINKRYLENYELDIEENRIYEVSKEKRKREEKRVSELDKQKQKALNTRTVKCPNCKAENKLEDKIGKCEYCRSYIE